MHFNKPHSVIKVEAKQLTYHHVVLLREKLADQFPAVQARGAEVLGAQIVLLLTGDFRFDVHHLRSERIIVV